ncbi:MAG: excinuclease ABC subunit UvrC [Desulfitobacterium hafniense]|nr:excinuclease ABC subunit UvrC [Desulfitobacterium hafniense]
MSVTLENKLKLLPDKPGVYLMKNAQGQIIYVGKARSLKSRVRSYFQSIKNMLPKVQALVSHIEDLEYIITDSEVESLILECNLIKKHRPKYNIRLRDDKTYPYLKVTVNEEYPRVVITRTVKKDGARYFGPFTSGGAVNETLKLLKKVFPLRGCKRSVLPPTGRPCLNFHIKRCLAPCTGQVDRDSYLAMIKDILLFLEGRQEDLADRLKAKMEEAAENLEFEKAAELRDQLRAIEKVVEKQKMVSTDLEDQDVIAMARGFDEALIQIFYVRGGKLMGSDHHLLQGTDEMSRAEVMTAFVKQFYAQVEYVPKEILVSEEIEELEIIEEWLKDKKGARVYIRTPRRGDKLKLVEMAGKNALQTLEQYNAELERKQAMTSGAVAELQQYLGLEKAPNRIECYDISNIQGAETVASMVVFEAGEPKNSDYRRFKIKTVEGPNDFASMQEVIGRRFRRQLSAVSCQQKQPSAISCQLSALGQGVELEEDGADEHQSQAASQTPGGGPEATSYQLQATSYAQSPATSFSRLPDLVIIDGGKGQLNAARAVMKELGFGDIPTYGLAKEFEHLFGEGNPDPIILPRNSKALYLVQRIRDEAHRFAITYHRKLRDKRNLRSVLEDIPGVGSKRKQALLKHFGSLAKIKKASLEELAGAPGMNKGVAQEVWEFFQHLGERE